MVENFTWYLFFFKVIIYRIFGFRVFVSQMDFDNGIRLFLLISRVCVCMCASISAIVKVGF